MVYIEVTECITAAHVVMMLQNIAHITPKTVLSALALSTSLRLQC